VFTVLKTFLAKLLRGHEQQVFEASVCATGEDFESRLHSLREEELFFWQPTPLSWY